MAITPCGKSHESHEHKPRNVARVARLVIEAASMNKKQASEYLGISTRQLENYVKSGRLSVRYERGRTGDQAIYDDKELRRLRAELEAKHAPRPAVVRESETDAGGESGESRAMVRGSTSGLSMLAALVESAAAGKAIKPVVSVADKPLLKLAEASALTGLSRAILLSAINAGTLKAKLIGRAWRVKRTDLDAFIETL
jgi:excisionase family DNA binding protein